MAAVYSTLLIANKDFTGEAAFEVPDGVRCVVRDIDCVVGVLEGGQSVWAYDTDGVQFWGFTYGISGNPFSSAQWRGRQVIDGPGFFYISTDASADIRSSGYLLSLP
jgi:hypothetical protein